jgi:acyl carrier protein
MDRPALLQLLAEVLHEVTGEAAGPFTEDQKLQENLKLDSLDMVSMAIEVQARLGIQLESSEMAPVVTVGDLLDLFQKKLAARAASRAA